jgi:hypothetical protein
MFFAHVARVFTWNGVAAGLSNWFAETAVLGTVLDVSAVLTARAY